jgi:hypothetical protein
MMDDSSTDRLPSECTSNEIGCLDNEGCSINMIEDDFDKYHDQYCLEMFRHALKEHDQQAQRWLQNHFSVNVLDLIQSHPSKDLACRLHSEEYYVIETFKRFWQTPHQHQEFEFKSMIDVLSYLRVSLNGVVLDALRRHSRPHEAPSPSPGLARELHSNENDSSHEVWSSLERKLSGARQRRLAYLLFHCALKPGEIVGSCPHEFSDIHEIYSMRRNIIELLSR